LQKFQFKYFAIQQENCTLKVGTDAMLLGASLFPNCYFHILDVGTSSGVLALMAKQLNPLASVMAIDIDAAALKDCRANFMHSPWNQDLHCIEQDVFAFNPLIHFDCVVCNPPYYEDGLLSADTRVNRAKHAQNFSLEELFQKVKKILTPDGDFWLILPYETSQKWLDYALSLGYQLKLQKIIYSKENKPVRMIFAFTLARIDVPIYEELTIRNEDNSYHDEYKLLTKEFHGKPL
jgi:tRNA1Val (adenine37-N6)-methyltransferase